MRAGARITGTIADGRCPAMKKMAAAGSMPARPPAISRPQSSSGEGELVYGLTGLMTTQMSCLTALELMGRHLLDH